jgi:esterase/lipase superfamily enzyme
VNRLCFSGTAALQAIACVQTLRDYITFQKWSNGVRGRVVAAVAGISGIAAILFAAGGPIYRIAEAPSDWNSWLWLAALAVAFVYVALGGLNKRHMSLPSEVILDGGVRETANSLVKGMQTVKFATNRTVRDTIPGADLNLDAITYERSTQETYGEALVSIPRSHKIGFVERPKLKWNYLWLRKEAEDAGKHFTLKKLLKLNEQDFYGLLKKASVSSALVFVHGYNVSFVDAIFKTAQIAYDANFPGEVVAFSWPSRASVPMYDYDRESALASPKALVSLLNQIKVDANIENIFLVAHSLGSQIVVDALQMASLSGIDLNLREVVFGAPDVDKDVFSSRAELIRKVAGGVTLYASSADKALIVSRTKAGGVARAGDMPSAGPLLIPGIDLIDVTAVGEDMFALNHGVFASNRSVLDDLGRIITSRTRPPHVRSPTLQQMPDRASPQYWMYPY